MRVLVLGGTGWLGGQVTQQAVARGLHVTGVSRGRLATAAVGVDHVILDRDGPDAHDRLSDLAGSHWDLVVDVSRDPRQVRASTRALASACGCYAFVSSGSVYSDATTMGQDESAPVVDPLAEGADDPTNLEVYGPAKRRCEEHVLDAVGADRALIVRAGLIGGPADPTARTTYWPWRFARAGQTAAAVLVPDAPDEWTQVIDVRDLAAWIVVAGTGDVRGVIDAVGDPLPLGEHLRLARLAAGTDPEQVLAAPDWLADQGVQAWAGPRSLPLWIGDPEWAGFCSRTGARGRSAGLVPRPLEQTLADGLAWERSGARSAPFGAGLTDDEERDLVDAWRHRA